MPLTGAGGSTLLSVATAGSVAYRTALRAIWSLHGAYTAGMPTRYQVITAVAFVAYCHEVIVVC